MVPNNIHIISPLQSGTWKNVLIQSVNEDFKRKGTIILVPAPSLRRVWREVRNSAIHHVCKYKSMQVHTDDHTTTDIRSILSRYIRTRRPVPRLKQSRQRLIFLGPGSWHSANPWRPNLQTNYAVRISYLSATTRLSIDRMELQRWLWQQMLAWRAGFLDWKMRVKKIRGVVWYWQEQMVRFKMKRRLEEESS